MLEVIGTGARGSHTYSTIGVWGQSKRGLKGVHWPREKGTDICGHALEGPFSWETSALTET